MLSGHKDARLREIDELRFILEQHRHCLGSHGRRHSRLQVLDAVPPDFRDPVVGWRQAARSDECLVYLRLACVALDVTERAQRFGRVLHFGTVRVQSVPIEFFGRNVRAGADNRQASPRQ
jgi:hypothetical protein